MELCLFRKIGNEVLKDPGEMSLTNELDYLIPLCLTSYA